MPKIYEGTKAKRKRQITRTPGKCQTQKGCKYVSTGNDQLYTAKTAKKVYIGPRGGRYYVRLGVKRPIRPAAKVKRSNKRTRALPAEGYYNARNGVGAHRRRRKARINKALRLTANEWFAIKKEKQQ